MKPDIPKSQKPSPRLAPWIVAALLLLLLSYGIASLVSVPVEIKIDKEPSPAPLASPSASPP